MLRDEATLKENHARFMKRAIEQETVWYLDGESGVGSCESNEYEETSVLLFWSDEAYARRAQQAEFDDLELCSMTLFDFLFRWLAGMEEDEVLAGTNWTGDLMGLEVDPADLKDDLLNAMDAEMLDRYMTELQARIGAQEGPEA